MQHRMTERRLLAVLVLFIAGIGDAFGSANREVTPGFWCKTDKIVTKNERIA